MANNAEGSARAFGSLAAIIALVGGIWGMLNQQELSMQRQISPIRINQEIILSNLQSLEDKFYKHVTDGHPTSLKLLLDSDVESIRKDIENIRILMGELGRKISALESRKSE